MYDDAARDDAGTSGAGWVPAQRLIADAVRSSSVGTPGAEPAQGAAQPTRTPEARLEEIERLYAAGTITATERDTARAAVLGSL